MIIVKQQHPPSEKLLLFFAGWSASAEVFARLEAEQGTDVMLCYDYRDTAFAEDLSRYNEIHLIAWSMGVRMAELAVGGKYSFATATAINGTPCPIDDAFGIPEKIFRGTLHNLTADGLRRFNRRMCGSREILARYEAFPARPIEEIRDELQHIYDLCHSQSAEMPGNEAASIAWTRAIIGSADHIFPTANQHNYWHGRCPLTEITSPHYPFYLWKQWNEL